VGGVRCRSASALCFKRSTCNAFRLEIEVASMRYSPSSGKDHSHRPVRHKSSVTIFVPGAPGTASNLEDVFRGETLAADFGLSVLDCTFLTDSSIPNMIRLEEPRSPGDPVPAEHNDGNVPGTPGISLYGIVAPRLPHAYR
ncbi:unnamed protein product, partial [Mesorhabditis belari]|uniref:Uncharacterized protein n=1 Tax=Mesorhabditis belari TaxID=2138241 RepID=A0AAF3ESE3_9BILA